jgi:large subunit ribosomal protein L7/L12
MERGAARDREQTMADDGVDRVDIVLDSAGERPIGIYDLVRKWTSLNVKQARKLVDSAPQPIITGMGRREAEAIKLHIEELGGTVSLTPSD